MQCDDVNPPASLQFLVGKYQGFGPGFIHQNVMSSWWWWLHLRGGGTLASQMLTELTVKLHNVWRKLGIVPQKSWGKIVQKGHLFWLLKMVCNTLPKLNTSQLNTLKTCLREREGSSTNHDFSGARLESNYTMTNDWNQDAFPNLEFKHAPSTRNTWQSLMNIWSRQTLIEGLHLKGAVLFSPEWCLLVGPVKKNLEHRDPFANKNPGFPWKYHAETGMDSLGEKWYID